MKRTTIAMIVGAIAAAAAAVYAFLTTGATP